ATPPDAAGQLRESTNGYTRSAVPPFRGLMAPSGQCRWGVASTYPGERILNGCASCTTGWEFQNPPPPRLTTKAGPMETTNQARCLAGGRTGPRSGAHA